MSQRPNVLVTGGHVRLGRAISERLASVANVCITYRSQKASAMELVAKLEAGGGAHAAIALDLNQEHEVRSAVGRAADRLGGRIDWLILSASEYPESTLDTMTRDDFDRAMEAQVWSSLDLMRQHKAQGGSQIIVLSDTRVESYDPKHQAYLLAKQSLVNLATAAAKQWAPKLRINFVAPGPILEPSSRPDASMEAAIGETLLGRMGDPSEIAHAVSFLLENEYIVGQTIYVDGGRHLRR